MVVSLGCKKGYDLVSSLESESLGLRLAVLWVRSERVWEIESDPLD